MAATPRARTLSAGKLRGLASLSDGEGRCTMLAIDQRGSLEQALGTALGREPTFEDVARFKQLVTRELAPHASAVLTDPVYGYAGSIRELPGAVGLLLAAERSGYLRAGEEGRARLTHLMEGFDAARARREGADALKLLVYYHPEAPEPVREHQRALVRGVGEQCAAAGLPFLLEAVVYPLEEAAADSLEFARCKPELVCRTAAEFSAPQFGVDVLKLEFPGDLKYAREYCRGAFDGRERPEAYRLAELVAACAELDRACGVPWVILSAGVAIREFLLQVELTGEAGASGFLCGRAIWQGAIPLAGSEAELVEHLRGPALVNLRRCLAAAAAARPLWRHPSLVDAAVEHAGPAWLQAGAGAAAAVAPR